MRELEVIKLIVQGYTRTETARELFVSVKTIDAHMSHVYEKAEIHNRTDLIAFCIVRGVLPQNPLIRVALGYLNDPASHVMVSV